ncbi:hypothetical protein [Corynebacterium sp. 20_84]
MCIIQPGSGAHAAIVLDKESAVKAVDAEHAEDVTIYSVHDYLPTRLRREVERESAHDEL